MFWRDCQCSRAALAKEGYTSADQVLLAALGKAGSAMKGPSPPAGAAVTATAGDVVAAAEATTAGKQTKQQEP
jgi:hypothetical protein